MIDLLQWNVGVLGRQKKEKNERKIGKQIADLLTQIVSQHTPSLVFLQECSADVVRPLTSKYDFVHQPGHGLTLGFLRTEWFQDTTLTPQPMEGLRAMGLGLLHAVGQSIVCWNVHLPSRMFRQDSEIENSARELAAWIRAELRRTGLKPAHIVAGDFNLQPYSNAMTQESGLFARRALAEQLRSSANDFDRLPLFNPSWELLGRLVEPLGTYFHGSGADGPWFVYDQTLVTPSLGTIKGSRLLEQVGATRLTSTAGRIIKNVASDHLPVLTQVQFP